MRKSDFKKGTVIEILSDDGRFAYAQVIAVSNGFAPLLALLDGVFDHSLLLDDVSRSEWILKKYANVNPAGSRDTPSVRTWKVVGKELPFLNGVVQPKALVHGDKLSDWKAVYTGGKKEYFKGGRYCADDFEKMGYAVETIWLSEDIENYIFKGQKLSFPNS
jgi:hypothetical protein